MDCLGKGKNLAVSEELVSPDRVCQATSIHDRDAQARKAASPNLRLPTNNLTMPISKSKLLSPKQKGRSRFPAQHTQQEYAG